MPARLQMCDNSVASHVFEGRSLVSFPPRTSVRNDNPLRHARMPIRISGLYGHDPKQNHLLGALPESDYQRLLPQLELVSMRLGSDICACGDQMRHVYFPTSSIVSMLHYTKTGASAETAVIGNEGMVGVSLFMGGGSTSSRMVVTGAGYGFRLHRQILTDEFARGGALQQLLLRYTQALIAQMSQTAVCNRHHSVIQQLCRWLLLSLDRQLSDELSMTQESIASMLGVRRESIAAAAGKLQEDGLIQYRRGHITATDRAGLEARVCECYAGVKEEYDRLLPGLHRHNA